MTIECYFSQCPYHSSQIDPDEGPFCDEADCKATVEEIIIYQRMRNAYLEKVTDEKS